MTKKLEEALDLAQDLDIEEAEAQEIEPRDVEEVIAEANEVFHAMEVTEKIDHALSTVEGLSEDDGDLDEIANKALATFQDMIDISDSMQDNYVARVYEVANSMLNTALNAREAKMNRKIKTLELQLKKANLDKAMGKSADTSNSNNEFDRNEILAAAVSAKHDIGTDKD